jgi:hypothetical protein
MLDPPAIVDRLSMLVRLFARDRVLPVDEVGSNDPTGIDMLPGENEIPGLLALPAAAAVEPALNIPSRGWLETPCEDGKNGAPVPLPMEPE